MCFIDIWDTVCISLGFSQSPTLIGWRFGLLMINGLTPLSY